MRERRQRPHWFRTGLPHSIRECRWVKRLRAIPNEENCDEHDGLKDKQVGDANEQREIGIHFASPADYWRLRLWRVGRSHPAVFWYAKVVRAHLCLRSIGRPYSVASTGHLIGVKFPSGSHRAAKATMQGAAHVAHSYLRDRSHCALNVSIVASRISVKQ